MNAHVFEAANPADDPFDAHAEAAVRHRSEAPQIEIPLEGFLRQVVVFDALQQQIVARETLTAADDFADAFGREHVDAQGELRPLGIGLHVERLDLRRIAMNRDGAIEVL
jgi:hypothetical protein